MTEQGQLWFEPPPADVPTCPRCGNPARRGKDGIYRAFCGGASCTSAIRICETCGAEYMRYAPGAGTKYCSTPCKRAGYGRGHPVGTKPNCLWCDRLAPSANVGGGRWPYVCETCTEPLKHVLFRLKRHNVTPEQARGLLADPMCQVCGVVNLIKAAPGERPVLVVDHDHHCCPNKHSCGGCVRGFVCSECNTAMGMARENPAILRAAADYIDRHNARRDGGEP